MQGTTRHGRLQGKRRKRPLPRLRPHSTAVSRACKSKVQMHPPDQEHWLHALRDLLQERLNEIVCLALLQGVLEACDFQVLRSVECAAQNAQMLSEDQPVERVSAKALSGVDFLRKYAEQNQPVILTEALDGWRAYHTWRDQTRPNFPHLLEAFAGLEVPVTDCSLSNAGYGEVVSSTMQAQEFVEYVLAFEQSDCRNATSESKLLYLKDWHIARSIADLYDPPGYLAHPLHDWLN
eukprot:6377890-Amphidinium_carterae.1